jgi:hypothetical protein
MIHLGIIGAPGVGKDTLAAYLIENKGYGRLAFADQIKKEYYAISGFSESQFKERGVAEQDIRDGLWKYSAKMKEFYGSNYFIKPVIEEMLNSDKPTVFTDVRTQCEMDYCLSNNVKLFIVIRDLQKEFNGMTLLGTQLELKKLTGQYPIFWNCLDNLEETYRNFKQFLEDNIWRTNGLETLESVV